MRVAAQKTRSHSAAGAVAKRGATVAPTTATATAKKRRVQDHSPTRAKSPGGLAKKKAPAKKSAAAKKTTVAAKKTAAKKKDAAKKQKPSTAKTAGGKKKEGKVPATESKKKQVPQKVVASKVVVLKKPVVIKKEPVDFYDVATTSADKPAEKAAYGFPEETRKKPLRKAVAESKERARVSKMQKPKSATATSAVKNKKKAPTKKQQAPKVVSKKPFVKNVVIVKDTKQKAAGRKKPKAADSKDKCVSVVTEKNTRSSVVGRKSSTRSQGGSAVDNDAGKKISVNISNTKETVKESARGKRAKNTVITRKPKKIIEVVDLEDSCDSLGKTSSIEVLEVKTHQSEGCGGNSGPQAQKKKCLSKKKAQPKSRDVSVENVDIVEEKDNVEDNPSISTDESRKKEKCKDDSCTKKVSPKHKTKEFDVQHETTEVPDTQPAAVESTDESTASDEMTLDRLRLQQLRIVKVPSAADLSSGCDDKIDKSIQVKPSSPSNASRSEELISTCDSLQFMGGITIKQEIEDIEEEVELKVESDTDNSSHFAPAKKLIKKKHLCSGKSKDKNDDCEEDGDAEDEEDDERLRRSSHSSKFSSLKNSSDTEQRARRMRLFGFWSGPKRHRVASLNALAKVHCLYENESKSALLGYCRASKVPKKAIKQPPEEDEDDESSSGTVVCTRTLRSMPGLRGVGKHWDVLTGLSTSSSSVSSSSSDDNENDNTGDESGSAPSPEEAKSSQPKLLVRSAKKVVRRKRKRCELMMDLKDMVVRKRMASLNASAILAASYSVEKRAARPLQPKPDPSPPPPAAATASTSGGRKKSRKRVLSKKIIEDDDDSSSSGGGGVKEVEGRSVIELRTAPASNNQVAVIVNQDTDVTITGVYVNSTTRSTHHEGFCSIAGMQYRISSTSHTQTEATAVATETVLHSGAPPAASDHAASAAAHHAPEPPLKSYTPLGALSSMQPPGSGVPPPPPPPPPPHAHQQHHHHHHHHHGHAHPPSSQAPPPPLSPLGRRHGCSSAFSAPPPPSYGPPPPPPQRDHDSAYLHGYYQPAGPLISSHHHLHAVSATSGAAGNPGKAPAVLPTLEASATPTPPPSAPSHSVPPSQVVSSNSTPSGTTRGGDESSDNDVIITATSCSSGGGEVISQQQPPTTYRYPAAYPPPTASTPHYAYPYTQHYPSPPSSASVQYAGPPHHYHAQELCYPGYPAASAPGPYFHKAAAYSTPPPPPPAAYHRRYLVPPAPQYYAASELYPAAAAPAASAPTPPQQNTASSQSAPQATQQMVVAGGGSYLSAASRDHAAPPSLVDAYPPPPPIVDPYPPPPGYYTGYGTGPASAACYTHSPPSRGLAFIDSAYPSCPCPMQSCPKNVHTGPLTGDGKGPHLLNKQQQPLPPVVLALPLEPPGALGPPSPARGSAGISQPPTPATASVRNPSVLAEEDCNPFSWSSDAHLDKLDPSQQEKHLREDTVQITVVTSREKDYSEVVATFPDVTEDMSQHRLLTIMKQPKCPARDRPVSRRHSGDSVNSNKNVPLLMCDKFQNRMVSASTVNEEVAGLVVQGETDGVKHERNHAEVDPGAAKLVHPSAAEQEQDTSRVETRQSRKLEEETCQNRKLENETCQNKKLEVEPSQNRKLEGETCQDRKLEVEDYQNRNKDVETSQNRNMEVETCQENVLEVETSQKKNLEAESVQKKKLDVESGQKRKLEVESCQKRKFEIETCQKRKLEVETCQKRKLEVETCQKETSCQKRKVEGETCQRNKLDLETSQKRKLEVNDSDKIETLPPLPAPKRQKCSKNSKSTNPSSQDQNSLKKENMFPRMVSPVQDNTNKKTAPLSSNNNMVTNLKPCPKKRKLEDSKDSCENAEPVESVLPPVKKKKLTLKTSKNPKDLKIKTYPSRAKQFKNKCGANCNSSDCDVLNVNVMDSSVCRNRTFVNTSTKKSNLSTVPADDGKTLSTKVDCKAKVNGAAVAQKKHVLRKSKQNSFVTDVPTTPPAASSKARRKNSSAADTNSVANKPQAKKSNLLQSQQKQEFLSEEETEIIPKVQFVGSARRPSLTANKKEQLKGQVKKAVKSNSEVLEQQKASMIAVLNKKTPLKRNAAIIPKWSNGWSWHGEPFYAKIFLSSDDSPQMRKCYPSMRHIEGDTICPRDCVLLKSGTRKIDLPFIAKVAALWENQDDGEMMVSLLWYYRPEHTDQGRREEHMEDEVFASKHKDTNSVACIEDKCYVLTFNEYCRFRKSQRRQEEGVREPALVVPHSEDYARSSRQPPACVASDMVFFCRKVYDFRQRRILKNPG